MSRAREPNVYWNISSLVYVRKVEIMTMTIGSSTIILRLGLRRFGKIPSGFV
jgi:hypothetical protein